MSRGTAGHDGIAGRAAIRPDPRAFALPGLALLGWWAAGRAGIADPHLLPSPGAVIRRAWSETASGALPDAFAASFARDLAGFAIGATAGLAIGALLGLSRGAARLLGPGFLAWRQVALFAWVPLLALWFGSGETGKIASIAVAALAPAAVNTWQGMAALPPAYGELARALGFRRRDTIRLIALPGALPAIATGLHTALIYAWLATIGAELFFNIAPGLAGRMNEGRETFQMDLLLVYLVVLGGTGIALNALAARLERLARRRIAPA